MPQIIVLGAAAGGGVGDHHLPRVALLDHRQAADEGPEKALLHPLLGGVADRAGYPTVFAIAGGLAGLALVILVLSPEGRGAPATSPARAPAYSE